MIKQFSLLSLFLFSLISYQGFAEEGDESPENGLAPQEDVYVTDGFSSKGEGSDPLEKLIELPEFKSRYDNCEKSKPLTIGDCIWNGNGADLAELTDQQKKTAQEFLQASQSSSSDGRQPAGAGSSNDKKYESLNISRFQTGKKDKALAKVEAYFSEKLKAALYGDIKDAANKKQVQVVDHGTFYDLFENRISKNIVEATSSFCIEAVMLNSDTKEYSSSSNAPDKMQKISIYIINKDKIDKVRKDSLANLKETGNDSAGKASNRAYLNWTKCITSLDYMCHGFAYVCKDDACTNKVREDIKCESTSTTLANDNPQGVTCDTANLDYTKGRACAVTNYLKNARQSLLAMTNVKEKWDELAEKSPGSAVFEATACKSKSRDPKTGKCTQTLDVKLVSKNQRDGIKPEIDKMNTLTSQELVDASGFKEEAKSIQAEYKKCIDGDDEVCKKFIAKDKKAKLKELAEMSVRSKAMLGKLESDEFNKDEVEIYLKEQGYTNEQIGDNLQDQAKLDAIKDEIQNKYKNERENLVAELKRQITDSTVEGDFDRVRDDAIMKKIGSDIKSRTERFADLVHFNNIVSGYLEIEDENTGAKTRNTASLYAEINDSSKDVVDEAGLEVIRSVAEEAGVVISDEEPEGGSPTLKVEELNSQILDYGTLDN